MRVDRGEKGARAMGVRRGGVRAVRQRRKQEYIGSVEAPDEKAAIAAAVKQLGITDPSRQQRLVARREP